MYWHYLLKNQNVIVFILILQKVNRHYQLPIQNEEHTFLHILKLKKKTLPSKYQFVKLMYQLGSILTVDYNHDYIYNIQGTK